MGGHATKSGEQRSTGVFSRHTLPSLWTDVGLLLLVSHYDLTHHLGFSGPLFPPPPYLATRQLSANFWYFLHPQTHVHKPLACSCIHSSVDERVSGDPTPTEKHSLASWLTSQISEEVNGCIFLCSQNTYVKISDIPHYSDNHNCKDEVPLREKLTNIDMRCRCAAKEKEASHQRTRHELAVLESYC